MSQNRKITHTDREHKKRLHFDHTNKYSTMKTKNTSNDGMQEVIRTDKANKPTNSYKSNEASTTGISAASGEPNC